MANRIFLLLNTSVAILVIVSLSGLLKFRDKLERAFAEYSSWTAPQTAPSIPQTSTGEKRRTGFCSLLPAGETASSLWKENLFRIANATRTNVFNPGTPPSYPSWIEPLLEFLNPRFLRLGYKHAPLPDQLEEILNIVYKRLQDPAKNPPLRIAVFGGSVTQGRGSCADNKSSPEEKGAAHDLKFSYQCNWVVRTQALVNEFLGPNVVEVHNLASGGTNSNLALPIIKYKLYNVESPHVIVNSYTTNDAFIANYGIDITSDEAYKEGRRTLAQSFIRAAQSSWPCTEKLPLVVYVDDYLGNQHNLIMGETANYRAIQQMTDWYHSMFISYAGAVRRLVYARQGENIFSAVWKGRGRKVKVDVHFPMMGHFALSWVVAFSVLQAIVNHCEDGYSVGGAQPKSPFGSEHSPEVMELVENVPPPILTKKTALRDISDSWREEAQGLKRTREKLCAVDGKDLSVNPCVIAFVAGPVGNVRSQGALQQFVRPITKNVKGWAAVNDISQGGWSNKVGYCATKPMATVSFFKEKIHTHVRYIEIHYLKSYGEKWENSTVHFTLTGTVPDDPNRLIRHDFELQGFHNSATSVSYPATIDLGNNTVPAGGNVELKMDLVGGKNFKIISLMMCDRQ